MTCNSDELVFAISTVAFVLSAFYSSWQSNSIMRVLALRHRGLYQALGKPHRLLTFRYLKHFAHVISAHGFEVGTPYVFGISASARLLRLRRLHEEEEAKGQGAMSID